jgi:uncharacterized membrane-anchored protein YitT (DUF2179 family)
MTNKKLIKQQIKSFILIVLGSVIMALSYVLFLIPQKIVPGGVTGISMILNRLFSTPIGILTIILNIPLFIWALKVLGRIYIIKSIIAVIISSLLIDFFTYVVHFPKATSNKLLAAMYGGIMLGLGLGIVFRAQASTGGTDIIGQIINRYSNFSTGTIIFGVDFVIITAAGFIFKNIELALYGYFTLYLSTKVIDIILEGASYTRAAFIISDKSKEISNIILEKLERGVTHLQGYGGFSSKEKGILFVVLSKRQIQELVSSVKEADPAAFVVITDVYEVLGKGFSRRTPVIPSELIGVQS